VDLIKAVIHISLFLIRCYSLLFIMQGKGHPKLPAAARVSWGSPTESQPPKEVVQNLDAIREGQEELKAYVEASVLAMMEGLQLLQADAADTKQEGRPGPSGKQGDVILEKDERERILHRVDYQFS
jgi:hypothetical protein